MEGDEGYGEEGYTTLGKEHYVPQKGESRMSTLIFFFLGAAAGAFTALLLAPQSGRRTREQIKEASIDVKERLSTCYSLASEKIGAVAETGKDLVKEGKPLFMAAIEAGISKVVYTSTAETIGEIKGEKKTETTPHRGYYLSDYAKSKHLAEQEAMRLCKMGLPLVCVNPTTVYGPGNFKESGKVIVDFLKGRLGVQFGSYMSFVYIDDAVNGHILAMEKGRVGERYILAGDEDILMKDLWRLIAELSGIHKIPREIPGWQVRILAFAFEILSALTKKPPMISSDNARLCLYGLRADNTKARTELGMNFTSLKDGLTRTIQWYREHCL